METVIEATADAGTSDPLGQLRAAGLFVLRQAVENPHNRKVLSILSHKCEFVDVNDPILIQRQAWLAHGQFNLERILTNAQAKGQIPADLDIRLAALTHYSGLTNIRRNQQENIQANIVYSVTEYPPCPLLAP